MWCHYLTGLTWRRQPALGFHSSRRSVPSPFPLEDIVAAHEKVEAAQHIGNVVVDIA
jgi:hypothetical protein